MGNDKIIILLNHETPAGLWWLHANTEKTQPCFNDNGRCKIGGSDYHHRTKNIWQYMAENDTAIAIAQCLCCLHIFQLFYGEYLATHNARYVYPHRQTDGYKHLPESFSQK